MPRADRHGLAVIAIATAVLALVPPAAVAATSSCYTPTLTQPFSPWGDSNWYALVPGQSPGNFDGAGWVLSDGAELVTTTVHGGATASVLELPSGAWAVSPAMCVDASDQAARTMVRQVDGASTISASVSYQDGWGAWSRSQSMGRSNDTSWWRPSVALTMQPPDPGGQMARFALSAYGDGASQIYNFYVDPYGRG